MAEKKKIAFICVHNSCRSQIAEALGKKYASDRYEFYSAGTETKPRINRNGRIHLEDQEKLKKQEDDWGHIRNWMDKNL